jgi:hypothetical protein
MASKPHIPSYRPAISRLRSIGRCRSAWLVPFVAMAILGVACATPGPSAPPADPFTAPASKPVGAAIARPAGRSDVQHVPTDPTDAAPGNSAPLGAENPTAALPSFGTDVRSSDAPIDADSDAAGARAHAGEIGSALNTADDLAPSAPTVPDLPVAVPPVLVPAAPVPSGLIQASEPPCGPGSGPRSGSWRDPLPQTPRHNPDGPKQVGLQAGHWLTEQVPAELRGLQQGATGGGKMEWEVNLDIARRSQALLEAQGVVVDILPTTVPVRYRAHLFVSIHADGDTTGRATGFKIARPAFSSLPAVDDRLVESLYAAYGSATGLRRDDEHITPRMRYYYAFNSRRFCHAVAPGVPQAIVETGFLTNAADRRLLLGTPDVVARGIADGILRFLRENP